MVQRLYSTFADRWPGIGLLLQRVVVAIVLVRFCITYPIGLSASSSTVSHVIVACAAMLFLVGLLTPFVGILIAAIELWLMLSQVADPWISLLVAVMGMTSAMLGPGAFSVDARLFGRRRLDV